MEEWKRWEPMQGLSGRFVIDSLMLSYDALIIQLSAEDNDTKIEIVFDGNIDAYRYTNESFCFTIFSDLSKKYGDDFYSNCSFFKITNSEYIQWISGKSAGWADALPFRHFCIVGNDEVLDILACYEPKVKIIE